MFQDGDRLIEELRGEVEMVTVNEEEEQEEEYRPRPKRRKVSPEDRIIDEFSNSNFGDQPLDEVQQYLNSFVIVPEGKIDLCKYWYENRELFPVLYKLSLKYLCVPGSSATAESKFSLAGFLINEKRILLNPKVVDDLLLLKSMYDNSDLFD